MFRSVKNWLTRPSWDEYLAEQKCRESAQDRAAELICEKGELLQRITAACNTATDFGVKLGQTKAELIECLKANKALNEDAASRIADWIEAHAKKTAEKMDAVRELEEVKDELEVVRYANTQAVGAIERKYNDLVEMYSNDVVALPFALRKVDELQAEVDRLRKLMMGEAEATPLHSIDIDDGEVNIVATPPPWACLAIARSFYETLDSAPNWRALEVGPVEHEGVKLIVTVRRMDGDTPEETVREHREMIEKLISVRDRDEMDNLVLRARALINPLKED